MTAARQKAVFVDRDGTLNEMVYDENHGLIDSPRRVDQLALMPGAAHFLKGLREMGYLIVIVTNQPGIAKGTLSAEDLDVVNQRLKDLLAEEGAAWDDFLLCRHHPHGGIEGRPEFVRACECRKPEPGMIKDAVRKYDVDLGRSWMIGDGLTDVQAGRAAGCRTILITKLKIDQVERFFGLEGCEPDAIVTTLQEALDVIRKGSGSS